MRAVLVAAILLGGLPAIAAGQSDDPSTGFAFEIHGGVLTATTIDQASLVAPDFQVWPQEVGGAFRFGGTFLLPTIAGRVRPHLRVSHTSGATVDGLLINDLARCPSCRDPYAGEVDRLDLTAGGEVNLFPDTRGRVRPYAELGVGLRRWAHSYGAFTGPGGAPLEGDSFSETGMLGRFGLGLGLGFGSTEVALSGAMQADPTGAGIVAVEPREGFASSEVDYGRELVLDFGLSLGLRRNF